MFREIIDIYCENHTRGASTLCDENADIRNVKPRGTYFYHGDLKVNELVLIEHEGPASPIRNSATGK